MDDHTKRILREIPKIDEVLLLLKKDSAVNDVSRSFVVDTCRAVIDEIRQAIVGADKKGKAPPRALTVEKAATEVTKRLMNLRRYKLRRVVNATGIILHTNLGRAPLCDEALERMVAVGKGYSNLEFDLAHGKRGLRYDHVTEILCSISGAEDALIVNNNAAAVLLVLNTLSETKESIVSRGELIEIGGEFRIPEVMEKSGAILREVGTTNRTHFADYKNAIGSETGLIMKVHTSNFRITGFTEEVSLPQLVALGKEQGIPVMNDLGSGCLIDLEKFGFLREPTVQEVVRTGVDVVTFSGDKLLGGPQAGIIVGKKEFIGRIKKNPLNRALRIDKLTLAALEATMHHYVNPSNALSNIKTLKSLTEPLEEVKRRAQKLLRLLTRASIDGLTYSLKEGKSMAGGGSLPTQEIPTMLLSVEILNLSVNKAEERLRGIDVPIIARISEDELLLDLKTISEDDFHFIEKGLRDIVEHIS
jgi:L-seryl-tRNA(Ser) seleniumtransferase